MMYNFIISSDGTASTHENLPANLLHDGNKRVSMLDEKLYELTSHEGYRR